MSTRGEIYTDRLNTEKRTYFFNVKENRKGDLFLNIVESNKRETGFERIQIIVYEEEIHEFLEKINKAASVIIDARRKPRTY